MSSQITYDDKVSLKTSPLPNANKCTADDLNEIKTVVNENATELEDIHTSFNNMVTEIYTAPSMTAQSSISFEDISDYDYVEIFYGQTNKNFSSSVKVIPSIAVGQVITFALNGASEVAGVIFYNVARYNLTATGLSFVRVTQKEFKADSTISTTTSANPTNIMVYKILGYKKS